MASMVFCRGCGKEIHSSAKSCPHCGATQSTAGGHPAPQASDAKLMLLVESKKKSGWIAALLNWFIPGAGYAYCGRWIIGILALLITIALAVVTIGQALWVMTPVLIIDGFLSAGRYNKRMIREVLTQGG